MTPNIPKTLFGSEIVYDTNCTFSRCRLKQNKIRQLTQTWLLFTPPPPISPPVLSCHECVRRIRVWPSKCCGAKDSECCYKCNAILIACNDFPGLSRGESPVNCPVLFCYINNNQTEPARPEQLLWLQTHEMSSQKWWNPRIQFKCFYISLIILYWN